MIIKLDPSSPIPLYHQLAEALRYQIATGRLTPGQAMPPVRDGHARFGVNLHTVRRAYAELAKDGLVTIDGPRGTHVASGAAAISCDVQKFVADTLRDAKAKFGLAPTEIAQLLTGHAPHKSREREPVYMLECSETQCADLAGELARAWDVDAHPWCLSNEGEPPVGVLVATYFHYNQIRLRWPHRLGQLRFITIRPDAAIIHELRARRPGVHTIRATLCERDDAMATNIIADLDAMLGAEQIEVVTEVTPSPAEFFASYTGSDPVLFSPRVWGELPTALRQDSRAVQARYVFDSEELDRLAESLQWPGRSPAQTSPRRPGGVKALGSSTQTTSA